MVTIAGEVDNDRCLLRPKIIYYLKNYIDQVFLMVHFSGHKDDELILSLQTEIDFYKVNNNFTSKIDSIFYLIWKCRKIFFS